MDDPGGYDPQGEYWLYVRLDRRIGKDFKKKSQSRKTKWIL